MIKKGRLCFGLLLACSIMLGLSLSASSDVSAYKYDLDFIPFTVPYSGGNNGIELYKPLRFESSSDFSMVSSNWFQFTARDSDGSCVYSSHRTIDSYTSSSNISSFSIPYTLKPTDSSWNGDFDAWHKCNYEEPFPSFQATTLPLLQYENFSEYLPYRFPYNAAYLKSNYNEDGFNVSKKFDFSDLFYSSGISSIPDVYFNEIDIPLGISTLQFSPNDHIEVSGKFYFDSNDPSNVFTLTPGASLTLQTSLLSDFNTYMSTPASPNLPTSVNCSMSAYENSNPDEARYILEYTCPFDITASTSLSGYTLLFRGPFNSSTLTREPIFTYDDILFWIYDSSVVITNYDLSSDPSGSSFQHFEFLGNKQHFAPGYAGTVPEDIIEGDINYSNSLLNLFSFDTFNPFLPIYSLFSTSDNCAQIPTLAGMLHSNEAEVCPWFSHETRQIVTPVLGLSSMMLIFGFFVRWLGSSSGNFFEDSSGETLTYSNWYSDGRGFHRTQGSRNRRINK